MGIVQGGKILPFFVYLESKMSDNIQVKKLYKKSVDKLFCVWYHVIKDKEMKQLNGTVYDVDTLKKKN